MKIEQACLGAGTSAGHLPRRGRKGMPDRYRWLTLSKKLSPYRHSRWYKQAKPHIMLGRIPKRSPKKTAHMNPQPHRPPARPPTPARARQPVPRKPVCRAGRKQKPPRPRCRLRGGGAPPPPRRAPWRPRS